jgi:hypothetical protein
VKNEVTGRKARQETLCADGSSIQWNWHAECNVLYWSSTILSPNSTQLYTMCRSLYNIKLIGLDFKLKEITNQQKQSKTKNWFTLSSLHL